MRHRQSEAHAERPSAPGPDVASSDVASRVQSNGATGASRGAPLPLGWAAVRSLAVVLLIVGSTWYGLAKTWHFTIDDAGISYAYALHWAEGRGLVAVVGGATVEGYSNFTWVALLALLAALGAELPVAAKWLAATFTLATALVVALVVTHGFGSGRRSRRWWELSMSSALAVVAVGLSANFLVWMPSGLENPLFAFLLVLLVLLEGAESRCPSRWPHSAWACVLLALTRPEGVAYAGVVALVKAYSALRDARFRVQTLRFFGGFLLPLLAYHVWHYATFGDWVPNTYFAKAPGQRDELKEGLEYVGDGLRESGLLVLSPLIALAWLRRSREVAVLAGLSLGTLAFAVYAGGDWMPRYRFVSFCIPLLACSAGLGAERLARWLLQTTRRAWFTELGAGALAAGVALWMVEPALEELDAIERSRWCHFCERVRETRALQAAGARLGLPGVTLLTQDFGGPSYLSSANFMPLDLLGLCDRSAALIQGRRGRTYEEYVLSRQQYWFHEQEQPPTLLSFPQHFWRSLSGSHELRQMYTEISPKRLNRKLRSDSRLRLAHAAFVDHHPPIEQLEFRKLTKRTRLIGAAAAGTLDTGLSEPAAPVRVLVSLSTRSRKPLSVRLRVKGGGRPTAPRSLYRESRLLDDLRNKPLRFDFELGPEQWAGNAGARPRVQIRVDDGHQKSKWQDVLTIERGRQYAWQRSAPRVPRALPGAEHPLLAELESRVLDLVDRRFAAGDFTLSKPSLGAQLMQLGERFERADDRAQAYLAYVLAVQADRDLSRHLARPIDRLRVIDRGPYVLESWLLSQIYETREPVWRLRLAWHLLRQRRWLQADYWLQRVDARELEGELRAVHEHLSDALLRGEVSAPRRIPRLVSGGAPKSIEGSFDSGAARGWKLGNFAVDRERGELVSDPRDPGKATSKPFTLSGERLTLLLRGEASAQVALWVDGERVRAQRGRDFHEPQLVSWDVTAWKGQRARLEVTKRRSRKKRSAAIDEVRLWP